MFPKVFQHSRFLFRSSGVASRRTISQSSKGIKSEVIFPGSVKSKITEHLNFTNPENVERMPTYRLFGVDGTQLDQDYEVPFSKGEAVKMYREMLTISIMDNILYDAQRQGRFSFYMMSAGEEGAAIGSAAAMKPEDVMFLQYREQGALLHRGMTLKEFMAQLYANKDDYGKGRNMPVHYQSSALNVHPISSPLATQISHASGAAYALKIEGGDRCVVCYFGEGAASEGDFHAALNIAATRSCPVIFFCRNNGYAISTPSLEQYKGDGIASRGVGYGIDTIRVDGNDLAAVHRVTKEARDIAVKEQKPVLIEAMSYRVSHHSTSDDSFAYRSRQEVEDWKKRDNPINRMRKWMEPRGWWSEEEEQTARKDIKKQVLSAFTSAEKVEKPALKYMFEDTYDTLPHSLKEQKAELQRLLEEYPDHYNVTDYEGGKEGL